MIIHMQDLLSKGKQQSFRTSLSLESLIQGRSDIIGSSPLDVRLDARGEGGIAHVDGELAADVEMACSRCLDGVKEHLVIPFHEQIKPYKPASAAKGEEDEEAEEEDDLLTAEGDKVDLKPYVEEAFLLYLPFAPLCDDACKGLCPQCGTNLNEQECGCSREVIDPRLAALKDLFKE